MTDRTPPAATPTIAASERPFTLVIRFGVSRSPSYTRALRAATAFGGFRPTTQASELNELPISAESFVKRLQEWQSVWHMVSYWKRSEVTLNGKPLDPQSLNGYVQVAQCWESLQKSPRADVFCRVSVHDGSWGCRLLKELRRTQEPTWGGLSDPRSYSCWYHFGQFASEGVWRIDKDAVQKVLVREADSRGLWLCPAFDIANVLPELHTLPDTIDTNANHEWYVVSVDGRSVEPSSPSAVGIASKFKPMESLSIGFRLDGPDADTPGLSDARKTRQVPAVSFQDIGGVDEIVTMVREVIELPLKRPDVLKHLGIESHRGVLLYGPPGCGKTLIAKAVAHEVQAHFISVRGPEILSKWFGDSELHLRQIFTEAREMQPSIVYFDELDSIAPTRSGSESGRLDSRIVNQLLTLMDGMDANQHVCTIASTNRPELLDPAVLRPGRFDYKIEIGLPNYSGRLKILQIHTAKTPLEHDVNLGELALAADGFSGAELAFVAREAAYNCLRRTCDVHALMRKPQASDPEALNQSGQWSTSSLRLSE